MPLEAATREKLDPTVRAYIDSLEQEIDSARERNAALERRKGYYRTWWIEGKKWGIPFG